MHTMTDNILEWRKIEFVIQGLSRWINETGLPDSTAQVVVEELADKFGLTDTMVKEILAIQE